MCDDEEIGSRFFQATSRKKKGTEMVVYISTGSQDSKDA